MSKKRLLALVAVFVFVAFPLVTFAWVPGEPIVPNCSFGGGQGPYCQACDLVNLVNNLLAFAVYLSAGIVTVMFAYAGFLYVTASSSPDNIKRARDIFGKVFLGFIFILTAWLIIDITLSVFTNKDFGFWSNVDCQSFGTPYQEPTGQQKLEQVNESGESDFDTSCDPNDEECLDHTLAEVLLEQNNIKVVSTGNCSDKTKKLCTSLDGVQKDTIDDVIAINEAIGGGVTVTAGTETGHQNKCHQNGTCVDIDVAGTGAPGSYNVEKINEVIEAGKKSGRCLVFEPAPGVSCPAGVTSCQEVSWATGDGHFSVYECK